MTSSVNMIDVAAALLGRNDSPPQQNTPLEWAQQQRAIREAATPRLIAGITPSHDDKLRAAAKAGVVAWLASLPAERLLHPFYMSEIQGGVAYCLALRGLKNTRLAPATISAALWSLGFARKRLHGTSRPQCRFWLHPAAHQTTTVKK